MKYKERDIKELQRITKLVTDKYKDRIVRERYMTPTVRKVVDMALNSSSVTEKKKEQLRHLKEAGYFDKKEQVVNQRVARLIDQEIDREINKSIAAGRLSKRPKHEDKQK